MKKLILALAVVFSFSVAKSQNATIENTVKKNFADEFTGATITNVVNSNNMYVVTGKYNGKKLVVNYDETTGGYLSKKTAIIATALPEKALSTLDNVMKIDDLIDAFLVETPGKDNSYEAIVL